MYMLYVAGSGKLQFDQKVGVKVNGIDKQSKRAMVKVVVVRKKGGGGGEGELVTVLDVRKRDLCHE